jgi:hypothetical protein
VRHVGEDDGAINAGVGKMSSPTVKPNLRQKALKTLAKSLFRELKEQGYQSPQIVDLSSELLDLINADLRQEAQPNLG